MMEEFIFWQKNWRNSLIYYEQELYNLCVVLVFYLILIIFLII